jgi:hypothetical protein
VEEYHVRLDAEGAEAPDPLFKDAKEIGVEAGKIPKVPFAPVSRQRQTPCTI